jgi:hypothetical protein
LAGILGCAIIFSGVVIVTVVHFGRAVAWIAIAVVVAFIAGAVYNRYRRREAIRRFLAAYPGKDVLITYSSSPHWQAYIEREWLPRAASRAVVFNRSLPWNRDDPHARLWTAFTGRREHTPSIIVLRDRAEPAVIGFFSAFRDYKHGKAAALREAESRVTAAGLNLDIDGLN